MNLKLWLFLVGILIPLQSFSEICVSYKKMGSRVFFNCKEGAKLEIELKNNSIVKIWYDPTGKFQRKNPSYAVIDQRQENIKTLNVRDCGSYFEIRTSLIDIQINKSPLSLDIFDSTGKLIYKSYQDYGFTASGSFKRICNIMRKDEVFFGLGEKAGALNRRGRAYKMWNSDHPCYSYTDDPLYKSIPFFMTNYHYGIFLDNTYKSAFKFGTESPDYYSFEVPGGEMVYYFIYGKNYKDIYENYIALTGNPILPPSWSLGFSQCRGMYTNQDQALIVAREFRRRKIPCNIIYQDIGWTDQLQNFEWRKNHYSNPKAMLDTLKSMGFRMIVSQDPVISQSNKRQWKEADSLGYFVKDSRTGRTYDMPWPWGGNCGVVDFTNPKVPDYWGRLQQKAIDYGISGFWTDMGEPAWSNEDQIDRLNMVHFIGKHEEVHNIFGLTWDKTVKEQFEKRNPGKRIFQMTRSAYAGLQRYTFGWTGDSGNGDNVLEGWDRLENQIAIGISDGIGGIPFFTTDISGYCGEIKDDKAMAELYTRWMQFGIFNPLSRAHHEGNNAVEPWVFGKQTEEICKSAIELKYRLFPYIYSYAYIAHRMGLPIIRGLFMEFPLDRQSLKVDNEFMYGSELLVAPVVKKGETFKQIYLPPGEWIDFKDKRTLYKGGGLISYPTPMDVIPMFIRVGSIIPSMPVMQYIGEKRDYPVFVDLFPFEDKDKKSFFDLYEDEGTNLDYLQGIASHTEFKAFYSNGIYRTEIHPIDKKYVQSHRRNFVLSYHFGRKPLKIIVNGREAGYSESPFGGEEIDSDFSSILCHWDAGKGTCMLKIPDRRKDIVVLIE